jgi:hypothetical protein
MLRSARISCILAVALWTIGCPGSDSNNPVSPNSATPVLTTITVSITPASIQVGQTTTASAAGFDQNGAAIAMGTVTWSTASGAVATVNTTGGITAVAAGQTQVIASAGGKQGQALVTVTTPPIGSVASVTIAPALIILGAPGQAGQLVATLRDAGGNVLVGRQTGWTSTKPSVATATGQAAQSTVANISSVGPGITQVTATSEGISGSVTVSVLSSGGTNFTFTCASIAGASVQGSNGQFLGRLTNALDSQSLMNTTGIYGSSSSPTSMYYTAGPYGSDTGPFSWRNPSSTTPPLLMVNAQTVAWVSINTSLITRVDADAIRQCTFP